MKHRYLILYSSLTSTEHQAGGNVRLVRERTGPGRSPTLTTVVDVAFHEAGLPDALTAALVEHAVDALIKIAERFMPDVQPPDWVNMLDGSGAQTYWIEES